MAHVHAPMAIGEKVELKNFGRPDEVREFPQGVPTTEDLLSMEGNLPFAWLTKEVSRSGVMGDATVATPEKGEKLLACLADGCAQAIAAVYHFTPPTAHH